MSRPFRARGRFGVQAPGCCPGLICFAPSGQNPNTRYPCYRLLKSGSIPIRNSESVIWNRFLHILSGDCPCAESRPEWLCPDDQPYSGHFPHIPGKIGRVSTRFALIPVKTLPERDRFVPCRVSRRRDGHFSSEADYSLENFVFQVEKRNVWKIKGKHTIQVMKYASWFTCARVRVVLSAMQPALRRGLVSIVFVRVIETPSRLPRRID